MKKIFYSLLMVGNALISGEISQYEALQKLNQVSGKLIIENEQIKKELMQFKTLLSNSKLNISSIDIKNKDSEYIDNRIFMILNENEILKRLERIEKKLKIAENEIIVEDIVPSGKEAYMKYRVSTKLLNVRDAASINSKIIEQYKFGKEVEGFDLKNGWVQIKNQNMFISKIYLEVIK
jgi:uncharacterized protein YgiM (DUF1202 family)